VIRVRYETDANAISGIEITANGQKLAWSISSYLDAFGQSLEKMLELQKGTESGSSSEPAPSTPSAPVVK
jgi:F-type H+-transporting ATPase subunit b